MTTSPSAPWKGLVCAGLVALLPGPSARAQDGGGSPQPIPAAELTPEEQVERRAAELAKILNPARYAPAFYSGAQAELVVPDVGVSSLLFGYEAVWMQVDLSFGMGLGGDPVADEDTANNYALGLRLAFPVHRGVRADYALVIGGGATIIEPPAASSFAYALASAGARFRMFMSPNVAVSATLGLSASFRGEHSSFLFGARPLGAAAVVYFFR